MKRFVTYIYGYEDKKKGNNVGFAKIEIRGEDCRIEIHLRGVYARQTVCDVYLFREMMGDIEGIRIGELRLINGNGDVMVLLKAGRIGDTPLGIGNMEGLFLMGEEGRIFMSRWKEGNPIVVCPERFRVWQEPAESSGQESDEASGQESDASGSHGVAETGSQKSGSHGAAETGSQKSGSVSSYGSAEENSEKSDSANRQEQAAAVQPETAEHEVMPDRDEEWGESEETVHATEIPVRNIFPGYDWQTVWEGLKQKHSVYMPFDDRGAECVQIELKDLRELPKRYWYLGNNSFLLHGFFNYRYLVVGKTGEERWFIGVPGIYQRQERVMAAIFGFPDFIAAVREGEAADGEEPVNRFGCWYRCIEE